MTHRPRGGLPRPTARQIHRGHRPAFSNLLSDTRLRLRAALLATVAVAVFLTFVVFPAQRLHVEADGSELMVVSRHQDIVSLLESAGIKRGFGDVLVLDPDQRQIVLDRATPVLVQVDGRSIWWRSRADTVVDLLGELEVTVGEHDVIVLNGVPAALDAGLEPGLEMLAATLSAGGILEAEARTPGVSVVIERASRSRCVTVARRPSSTPRSKPWKPCCYTPASSWSPWT